MTYALYHQVKRGTIPKTVSTYVETKIKEAKEEKAMKKYRFRYAVISTIPRREIRTVESPPEPPLKSLLTNRYARCVGQTRMILSMRNERDLIEEKI